MGNIERELNAGGDLVDILAARAPAPGEPEHELGGGNGDAGIDLVCRAHHLKFWSLLAIIHRKGTRKIPLILMTPTPLDRYHVEVLQSAGLGSPCIVRVYKRYLFFKCLMSSDWFLDEAQARQFAEQARSALQRDGGAPLLRNRPPGWTLSRPVH